MDILDPHKHPWLRQDGETDAAFNAFCHYRNLPTSKRSQGRAWGRVHKRDPSDYSSQYARWSIEHSWVDRASAWDAHLERIHRLEMEEAARQAERMLAKEAEILMHNALVQAKQGDVRMLKDLLDRLAVGSPRRVEVSASDPEQVRKKLAELLGSD